MSISDEILRLQTAKSDLATSIANKGVTVPASATLDDYPALVDSIQTGGGSSLPYDAEVEYLQSNGTQYIDTGVVLTKNYLITIECAVIDKVSQFPTVCGAYSASNMYSAPIAYNNEGNPYTQVGGGNSHVSLYTTNKFGSDILYYICRGNGRSQYISDGFKTESHAFSGNLSSLSMYMFARHRRDLGGVANYAIAKIGKVNITIDGVMLRDFIPVRVGQVGYMYDKVSKQLFGNSGTGSFTLGQDVS